MIEVRSKSSGTVTFDGSLITISRDTMAARSVFGRTQQTIPVAQVSGIEWRDASRWHGGYLRLLVAGSQAAASQTPVNRDANAVFFSPKTQPEFEKLRKAIEQALSR